MQNHHNQKLFQKILYTIITIDLTRHLCMRKQIFDAYFLFISNLFSFYNNTLIPEGAPPTQSTQQTNFPMSTPAGVWQFIPPTRNPL